MTTSSQKPSVLVEACVDSASSASIAEAGGVDRVELCANLVEGGTTPSQGTVELAVERLHIPCAVMVRPRGGDFCYSSDELEIMQRDISLAKRVGAYGVVFGCLAPDGVVDRDVTQRLVDSARPLAVTFHRAFDMTREPFEALDVLLEIGVDRLLTSGQRPQVTQALDLVASLVRHAGNRLVVMPGGEVTAANVREVVTVTGAREVHVYTERESQSPMRFRNTDVWMGRPYQPDEFLRVGADPQMFARVVSEVRATN